MAWFEDLHLEGKGSFRGVEFLVTSISSNIGRRTVVHEFPGRDRPYVEDLGRLAREFQVDAYVIGPEYMVTRDDLRVSIESVAGPGELIHPYWGTLQVTVVGAARIRETPKEGGIARISFTVVEAGDEIPLALPDLAATLDEVATIAIDAVGESFSNNWATIFGAIAAVVQAAINLVNAVASTLNRIKGYVNAVMAVIDTIGDAIAAIIDGVTALVLLPGQLAASFQGVISDIVGAVGSLGDAWDSYFDSDEAVGDVAGTPATSPSGATPATGDKRADILMKTFRELAAIGDDFAPVPLGTGQRAIQAQNQAALVNLIQATATIEVCRTVADIPFSSLTKAESVRDEVLVKLDALIEIADDITYGPLVDLRVAFVQYLQDASASLPRIISYTPATTLPTLVISQQIYGDSTRENDVLVRNRIRNPCEVPGGASLEVLSDE